MEVVTWYPNPCGGLYPNPCGGPILTPAGGKVVRVIAADKILADFIAAEGGQIVFPQHFYNQSSTTGGPISHYNGGSNQSLWISILKLRQQRPEGKPVLDIFHFLKIILKTL